MNKAFYRIEVQVETCYIEEQSIPEDEYYTFAYSVIIRNAGTEAAKLVSRHWYVTDANGGVQEVQGMGVVGEQPHLFAGQEFRYTSGVVIPTPVGTMHGAYTMATDAGEEFEVEIPAFRLAAPNLIH